MMIFGLFFLAILVAAGFLQDVKRDRERARLQSSWMDKREARRQTTAEVVPFGYRELSVTTRRALRQRAASRTELHDA